MQTKHLTLNDQMEGIAGLLLYNREAAATNGLEYKTLLRVLSRAMQGELTGRQLQCLNLQYEQQLSVTEIACRLGLCKSTVSRHLSRSKEKLHKVLKYYM